MTWRADGPDGPVAVKEIPLRRLDPKARELVQREARVLAELDHPAVPRLLDTIEVGSGRERALFLVQELLEGETLEQEARHHRYTEAEVCAVIAEVAEILADLHARRPPLVHRDVKPANLVRRADGRLALVDFGSVRDALRDRDLGGSTVAGTFGFMAPEQFRGDASTATDLFGLGATAVALLTRRPPHELQDWDQRVRWRDAVQVSPRLAALLDGLLELDAQLRLDDARSVARLAREAAGGEADAQPQPRTGRSAEAPAPPALLRSPTRVDEVVRRLLESILFLREGALSVRRPGGLAATPVGRSAPLGFAVVGGLLVLAVVLGGVAVGTTVVPLPSQLVGSAGLGLPTEDRQPIAEWSRDLVRTVSSSGAADACVLDDLGPIVVPMRVTSDRLLAGTGAADLTPAQSCWAGVVEARRERAPRGVGDQLWLAPGAVATGPQGLQLPSGDWVDPLTGRVNAGSPR